MQKWWPAPANGAVPRHGAQELKHGEERVMPRMSALEVEHMTRE